MSARAVIPITYDDSIQWVLNKHYAKRIPNIKYAFGLLTNNTIIGIVTFGIPASPFLCKGICGPQHRGMVLELNRLCIDDDAPRNSASYLIGNAIKQLPPNRILVSYSDTAWGHIGYVYQATNWLYTGITKEQTDMYAGNGKHSRHHQGDKHNRVIRSAKHRYIYFHKCGKDIVNALRFSILPYPKGETRRYDASAKFDRQQYLF